MSDGRHKRGVRSSVALILTLIVLAKLAGMTTPLAIAEWVRLRAGWLSKVLPVTRASFPCASTVSQRVTDARCRAGQRGRDTGHDATKRCGEQPSRLVGQAGREQHVHVALDGKTLRGTLSHEATDQRKMHQVALYETGTGLVLKAHVVGDKENELSIVSQFLSPVWVKGRIISADALHTQRSFCSEPPVDCQDWRMARSVDKGHGRLEIRELEASSELNDFLAGKWTGVAQVFRLVRSVTKKGKTSEEVVYGLTALSPAQASAQDVLALVRDHWTIENRLHYRRDVTLREDACQVRKGEAPRVLAGLARFLGGLQCPQSDAHV